MNQGTFSDYHGFDDYDDPIGDMYFVGGNDHQPWEGRGKTGCGLHASNTHGSYTLPRGAVYMCSRLSKN